MSPIPYLEILHKENNYERHNSELNFWNRCCMKTSGETREMKIHKAFKCKREVNHIEMLSKGKGNLDVDYTDCVLPTIQKV